MAIRFGSTVRLKAASLTLIGGVGLVANWGCSVQESRLITRQASSPIAGGAAGSAALVDLLGIAGTGPVTPAVAAAIDERPIGGASLNGGTTGGGTYADALNKGQLYYVDSVEGIRALISSDTPAILLIAEGKYDFGTTATKVAVCSQTCDATALIAAQTTVMSESSCTSGAPFEVDDTEETLRFGNNKTLIGLGKGAILRNALVLLSNASNIILRNLAILDNNPSVFNLGGGIEMMPSDHVWVDHCTFRNIGRAYINISASIDGDTQAILKEAGYTTLTYNLFDGMVEGFCRQRSQFVLGTRRVPALTLAHNWFYRSENRNPLLAGPETWAHVFNNYWSDINYSGLAAACAGAALMQGNAFESATSALSINDNGADSVSYCAANPWGRVYAPMNTGTDEDNLFDSKSTLTLHGQPTDGTGITKPVRRSGHTFALTAPTKSGTTSEAYEVTLMADPASVAADVKTKAGVGTLF